MIKGILASDAVAMVTYCVTKMATTCSPMVGQFFDTMIEASSDRSGHNDPSNISVGNYFESP